MTKPISCFDSAYLEKVLSKEDWGHLNHVISGEVRLDGRAAETAASAFKKWALERKIESYAFWGQPLANPFFEAQDPLNPYLIECFPLSSLCGSKLMRQEIHLKGACSFIEKGPLLTEGYFKWDAFSYPFIQEDISNRPILMIPGLFFSFQNEALDQKIPLLRSEERICEEASRLLQFCSESSIGVQAHLEIKQQVYLVDKRWYLQSKRCSVFQREESARLLSEEQVGSFARKIEEQAKALGLFVKIGAVKNSPGQLEVAIGPCESRKTVDLHMRVLELMQKIGSECDWIPLFDPKPFASKEGSIQSLHWTLVSQEEKNLLDREKISKPISSILFTAILYALYDHIHLLYAAFYPPEYERRLHRLDRKQSLGGMDVQAFASEMILQKMVPRKGHEIRDSHSIFSLDGESLALRGPWLSLHPAFMVCTLQAALADALHLVLDELSDAVGKEIEDSPQGYERLFSVLEKRLREVQLDFLEKKKRMEEGFSPTLIQTFIDRSSVRCFNGILGREELQSRCFLASEHYAHNRDMESDCIAQYFRLDFLPRLLDDFKDKERQMPQNISSMVEALIQMLADLDLFRKQCSDLGPEIKAKAFFEIGVPKIAAIQELLAACQFAFLEAKQ